jgi:hypothetical protein
MVPPIFVTAGRWIIEIGMQRANLFYVNRLNGDKGVRLEMIDVRSQHIEVSRERRQYPRLEFRCTALFGHLKDVLKVTDLSLNGLFVEVAG